MGAKFGNVLDEVKARELRRANEKRASAIHFGKGIFCAVVHCCHLGNCINQTASVTQHRKRKLAVFAAVCGKILVTGKMLTIFLSRDRSPTGNL